MSLAKTRRYTDDSEYLTSLEKIKETYLPLGVFWELSGSFGFPKNTRYPSSTYPQRCKHVLNEYLDMMTKRLRSRVVAFGVIVFRENRAPHAHILMTSIKYNFLDQFDKKEISGKHWPFRCKIRYHKEISQQIMINYLFKPWNFNLNSNKMEHSDVYYYRKANLDKHQANLIIENGPMFPELDPEEAEAERA